MLAQIEIVVGHQEFAIQNYWGGDADRDQAVGVGIWKTAEEKPVDDAENGGGGADSQSDYENCGERKSGIPFKLPEGEAQVEPEGLHA
jgi:hypothetical protein